jgi:hypothetical protein
MSIYKRVCMLALIMPLLLNNLNAKTSPKMLSESSSVNTLLLSQFKKDYKNKSEIRILKKRVISKGPKAVPVLVQVMKSSEFPDKNRWVATFLLGKIMGIKSSKYISKYLIHPNWILRMASLKTLLSLKQKKFGKLYAKALKDKSFIVRTQALENIRSLKLGKMAPYVWAMLYNKENYYTPKNKGKKRTNIIKKVIKVVGDLKFEKASKPLLTMIQKLKYDDIFDEMDYSLKKIIGKKSPEGSRKLKRFFWQRIALAHKEF